jgi:hypothetical protein
VVSLLGFGRLWGSPRPLVTFSVTSSSKGALSIGFQPSLRGGGIPLFPIEAVSAVSAASRCNPRPDGRLPSARHDASAATCRVTGAGGGRSLKAGTGRRHGSMCSAQAAGLHAVYPHIDADRPALRAHHAPLNRLHASIFGGFPDWAATVRVRDGKGQMKISALMDSSMTHRVWRNIGLSRQVAPAFWRPAPHANSFSPASRNAACVERRCADCFAKSQAPWMPPRATRRFG